MNINNGDKTVMYCCLHLLHILHPSFCWSIAGRLTLVGTRTFKITLSECQGSLHNKLKAFPSLRHSNKQIVLTWCFILVAFAAFPLLKEKGYFPIQGLYFCIVKVLILSQHFDKVTLLAWVVWFQILKDTSQWWSFHLWDSKWHG